MPDRGTAASNEILLALQEVWQKWIAAGANPAELAAIGDPRQWLEIPLGAAIGLLLI